MQVLWGIGGMVALLLIAFAMSDNRRAIRPRTVLGALAIQLVFGWAVLHWEVGKRALSAVSTGVQKVIDTSKEGIDFLVGPLIPPANSGSTIFAFQVLPIIVFVASLTAVLYHWNILQWIVRILGGGLQKLLGTTRAESLNATANIFVGQTEAPLVIRPYLAGMSRSEFFAVMVGGLATVAGSVMVGYAMLGARLDYLIAASFMAAPAGLLMAKIIIPEVEKSSDTAQTGSDAESGAADGNPAEQADGDGNSSENGNSPENGANSQEADDQHSRDGRHSADDRHSRDGGRSPDHRPSAERGHSPEPGHPPEPGGTSDSANQPDAEALPTKPRNVIDAAATGATDGLKLALNVAAMLFAFISLIALLNLIIGGLGGLVGLPDLSFEQILGYAFSPIMFVIGVPWHEAIPAGALVGQKLAINEFLAFTNFGSVAATLSDKTRVIVTFALTGFANFSSLAILLGGLGGLVPQRRDLIAKYGIRAVLAATLANLMSATIAGMLM